MKYLVLTVAAMVAVSVVASTASIAAAPARAAGDWIGTATIEGVSQHVAVHIHKSPSGNYTGTIARPESSPASAPLTSIGIDHGAMVLAALDGTRFRGSWDSTSGQWVGALNQSGVTVPVSLKGDDDQNAVRGK